jgi:hypothetical protein
MRRMIFGAIVALAAMCGVAAVAPQAKANDYRVVVYNNTSYTIYHIYAANRDQDVGTDVLGEYMLPPGYHVTVDLDDDSGYCIFNMRATTRGGHQNWELSNFNACALQRWDLDD